MDEEAPPKAIAGYSSADMAVTEAMMRDARAIAADPFRFKALLEDQFTAAACQMIGIELEELLPRAMDEFRMEVERARTVPSDVQKKRFHHFEARRIWKLAAVMGERVVRVKKAAEVAEKARELEKTIVRSYSEVMKRESSLLYKERVASTRTLTALKKEHELVKTRREDHDEKLEVLAERHARMLSAVESQQQQARNTSMRRTQTIREQIEDVRESEEVQRLEQEQAVAQRQIQLQEFEASRVLAQQKVVDAAKREQARREVVLERVREQDALFRTYAKQQIQKKGESMTGITEMRAAAIATRKEDRRLMFQTKMENSERIKKLQHMRRNELAGRIALTEQRLEQMRVVRTAVGEERKMMKHSEIVHVHALKAQLEEERPKPPGPAEYEAPPPAPIKGGAWGANTTKSALTVEVERAALVPGPGRYNVVMGMRTDKGVAFGDSVQKGSLDIIMERSGKIPGPAEYETRPKPTGPAVQFSESAPGNFFHTIMKRGGDTPGPGAYLRSPVKQFAVPKLAHLDKTMLSLAGSLGESIVSAPIKGGKVLQSSLKLYY